MDFKGTFAHELGHPILLDAQGQKYSWGHKGTSDEYGGSEEKKMPLPETGHTDLMMYYDTFDPKGRYIRGKVSENDMKSLIYVSKRK